MRIDDKNFKSVVEGGIGGRENGQLLNQKQRLINFAYLIIFFILFDSLFLIFKNYSSRSAFQILHSLN